MLVLTRQLDESFVIDDRIVVTLRSINKAKKTIELGIEAPKQVAIYRKELLDRAKQAGIDTRNPEDMRNFMQSLAKPKPTTVENTPRSGYANHTVTISTNDPLNATKPSTTDQ